MATIIVVADTNSVQGAYTVFRVQSAEFRFSFVIARNAARHDVAIQNKAEWFIIIYWIASAAPRNDRDWMDCHAAAIALLAMTMGKNLNTEL